MKQESPEKNSRRKFLLLGLFENKVFTTEKSGVVKPSNEDDETIPMLTPDGKLVAINKALLGKAKREKASNTDILNWSNSIKNTMLP
jgi:hypothetical protein